VVLGEEPSDDGDDAVAHRLDGLGGPPFGLRDVDLAVLVGDDRPVLPPRFEKQRVDPPGFERPLQHPDRGPLAHADDLGPVGFAGLELDLPEEVVGRPPHRADDDGDLVPLLDCLGNRVRGPVDPVAIGDARPAKLDDQAHRITRAPCRSLMSRPLSVTANNCFYPCL